MPSCSLCKAVARIATELPRVTVSKQLNLTVYNFTLDGGGLPGFQVPIPATRKSERSFGREQRRSSDLLINVNSQKFTPISRGDIDYPTLFSGFSTPLMTPREALQ